MNREEVRELIDKINSSDGVLMRRARKENGSVVFDDEDYNTHIFDNDKFKVQIRDLLMCIAYGVNN